MKTSLMLSPLLLAVVYGCASTGPTPELIDARRAYDQARSSHAATYSPDKLLSAKQALERAEKAHADDAGSSEERSYAYIAQRKSQLAQTWGAYEKDVRDKADSEQAYRTRQDDLRRQAEQTAENANANLSSARRQIATQSGQLEQEREARRRAETVAAEALASLQQIASVKEESRGTVITLDGSVLFVTGKAELLPIAREKLNQVAKALKDLEADQTAVVEGYTDSRGSDETNLKLSQDRANSVRDYLVSQGVKAERITAVGKGEANPVASNDTAEGRANNRRVEIVVSKSAGSSGMPGSTTGSTGSGTAPTTIQSTGTR